MIFIEKKYTEEKLHEKKIKKFIQIHKKKILKKSFLLPKKKSKNIN